MPAKTAPGREFLSPTAVIIRIIPCAMERQLLLPPDESPKKRFWKAWKWIGLLIFAAVLLLSRWLPGPLVAAGYLYGIGVIANLLFYGFRYLKDRLFWRVRNRIIGSFIFIGIIPIVLLLAVVFLSAYLLAAQLAGRYLETSLREMEHQITEINEELAGLIGDGDLKSSFPAIASRIRPDTCRAFSRIGGAPPAPAPGWLLRDHLRTRSPEHLEGSEGVSR